MAEFIAYNPADSLARPASHKASEWRDADVVITRTAVQADDGVLPAGSEGTIIDVSPIPGRYGVEFLAPFHCIVFLDASQLRS